MALICEYGRGLAAMPEREPTGASNDIPAPNLLVPIIMCFSLGSLFRFRGEAAISTAAPRLL
jgi:hypothetical protein